MSDQEAPQEEPQPTAEPEKPAEKRGVDWLTVALVLVIAANIGLYVYNTQSRATQRPGPAPNSAGPPPASPGRPGPGGSPGPGGPPPGQVPPLDPASTTVADLLTSPQGMATLMDLGAQEPPKGLTADQKKRLVAALGARMKARNLGSSVTAMMALLKPAQLEFLRSKKEELPRLVAAGGNPVEKAVAMLKSKAGGADPAVSAPPEGGPEFDPQGFAQGLLLLEEQKGDLALQPAQAAAILPILQSTEDGAASAAEDAVSILTPAQREWIEENAPKADVAKYLGGTGATDVDLAAVLHKRMEEEFGK